MVKRFILIVCVSIAAFGLWSQAPVVRAGVQNDAVTAGRQVVAIAADSTEELWPEYSDALIAPDLPLGGEMSALAAAPRSPGYFQTSEYMAGSVAVGLVLVESDGSLDPSTEDWTLAEKQQVYNEVTAGLDWWASQEPRAHLSFVYDDHFSDPLPTGLEPISRPHTDQERWVADAMGKLGYNDPYYLTRVRAYTNDLRATYKTDWAFVIFVVDSSNDSDQSFSDGWFAYTYLGGPFLVMTYGNGGYGPDDMKAVTAHETGHIFYALDQYHDAQIPCASRSGYLGVETQNSEYGDCVSGVESIMRGVSAYPFGALDRYAAEQVGWRDSDGDDILDPLDTDLPIQIDAVTLSGNRVTVSGTTQIIPYERDSPSFARPSVTINTLTGVQYRFDGGDWQPATAEDGAFDELTEDYYFSAASLSPGQHSVEVTASDSAGNVSAIYATKIISVPDSTGGGPPAAGEPAFTVFLPLVQSASVQAPSYEGDWQGTTSQQRAIMFTVHDNAITLFGVSYVIGNCFASGYSPAQSAISEGAFSLVVWGGNYSLAIQGIFSSDTTASGELQATMRACGEDIDVSWNVTKQ
ncbi:MAG: hypothetical protein JW850_03515 [Thermoflexales bacterium]|nr:hypothetical protein [Thermoflexales bacterium]